MLPRIAASLQKELPDRAAHAILFDGEKLLRTDEAKNAMAERGLRVLPGWFSSSPDLDPQENVWTWVRTDLRKWERKGDTFPVCLQAKVFAFSSPVPRQVEVGRVLE